VVQDIHSQTTFLIAKINMTANIICITYHLLSSLIHHQGFKLKHFLGSCYFTDITNSLETIKYFSQHDVHICDKPNKPLTILSY